MPNPAVIRTIHYGERFDETEPEYALINSGWYVAEDEPQTLYNTHSMPNPWA